ncbi:heme exporter protein D [Rhodanobacter sp. A1T4]|jgi:heme exporter protein D|nr:heme exporter protein D [Rhodanobacter sp. MP1X3]MBB6245759.1 heme exporter protein D [Rhodanobacter sp. A1T4]
MNASSLQHFLAMGGYAGYLWPAYAVFFIVLLADFFAPLLRRRRLLRELRSRLARKAVRQQRQAPTPTEPA